MFNKAIARNAMAVIVMTVLFILVGCSDQLTDPFSGINTSPEFRESYGNQDFNEKLHQTVSLKPHQTHSFNFENTGYTVFNSISVFNCGLTKDMLDIAGYFDDEALILGCNSSGFRVYEITITNRSGSSVDVDVFLTGTKEKIRNPLPTKNKF